MVMKVLCYVVTYHSRSEMKKRIQGRLIVRQNIPDVQAPTTTTFFPSYSLAFV